MVAGAIDVDAAYASCVRDARRHYENFPVASLLVPAHMRRDIAAVYAFARAADDFADEGDLPAVVRYRLLDGWLERLRRAAILDEPGPPPRPGEPVHAVEIFVALGDSMRRRALPVALFEDLLSAFRQDVTVAEYETWSDLLDYCRRSANPVGRLVLRIAGYQDQRLDEWSDDVCTALQLTNFWQDLAIDLRHGRSYLPAEERRAHASLQGALAAAAGRTRALFAAGRPLCSAVRGRLRYELRATWLGGVRILNRLEHSGFHTDGKRPALGVADLPWLIARLAAWRTP
jgi:hydroxysqualene synthase